MIQILDKTRTVLIAIVDLDELNVDLNIQNYSKVLLSLTNSLQSTFAKDFANLLKLNADFDTDLLDSYLHLLMNRYCLLVDHGCSEKVEEDVPY